MSFALPVNRTVEQADTNCLAMALTEAVEFFTCSQATPVKASALSSVSTHQRNDSQYDRGK